MKRRMWLAPLVLSASVILPGCKDSSNAPQGQVATEERRADTKMSDADLEKAIKGKLDSDNAIRQANISVDADRDQNKATLKGTVASQELRSKAVELAKSAQPRLTINDEIEVKPAG